MDLIRILLADSHRLLHPSIQTIFSTTDNLILTDEVTDSHQLLQQIRQENPPDLVLLSPNITEIPITHTIDTLKELNPAIKILGLLSHPEETCVRKLIKHDITGIMLKSETPDKLIEAIHTIMQGQPWFSATLIPRIMQPNISELNELTDRELDVLKLLTKENTNIEIAQILNISERTVRCHLENIYGKLGVKSRTGAAIQAFKLNLIAG